MSPPSSGFKNNPSQQAVVRRQTALMQCHTSFVNASEKESKHGKKNMYDMRVSQWWLRSDLSLGSEFLATDPEVRVSFPVLPDFLRSSGSGMGSTQPREYNCGAT
jgi:hypothetical protein